MSQLEAELALAEQLKRTHATWKSAVAEYRRVLRSKRTGKPPSISRPSPVLALPPPELDALATALSAELARVTDGRHQLYLALSGSLLSRGIAPAMLPALIAKVARDAGDAKVRQRVCDAESTAAAWTRGAPVTAYLTLRSEWPAVAGALDAYLPQPPSVARDRVEAALSVTHAPPRYPLAIAVPYLKATIATALTQPGVLTVFQVDAGVGKSRAATTAALESGTRVAVVAPTNVVSRELYQYAASLDPAVQRRFGALSVLRDDGTPVCTLSEVGQVLQEGRFPIPQRLCIRCRHRQDCTAQTGREGNKRARIAVTNHAMTDAALEHAGAAGALILDEMPSIAVHTDITTDDLQATLACLGMGAFARAFSDAAIPFARLVRAASDIAEDGEGLVTSTARAARQLDHDARFHLEVAAAETTFAPGDDGDLDSFDQPRPAPAPAGSAAIEAHCADIFRAAWSRWPNHPAPPTTRQTSRHLVVGGGGLARDLATASRVLGSLRHVVECGGVATWHASNGAMTLVVSHLNPAVVRALQRRGPTVILDATADLVALRKISPRPVLPHVLRAADAAPVARTLLATSTGAKSHLAPNGIMSWTHFGPALCEALAIAGALRSKNVLVITHKVCADAIRKTSTHELPHARLAQVLQAREMSGGKTVFAHFGAIRGRNDFDGMAWQDTDVVITIGDPWPDVGRVRQENAILGLTPEEAEARTYHLAAAELAQAHGRLRAPRRQRPGFAVHAGSVLPLGWTRADTTVTQPHEGRPVNAPAMERGELRVLVELAGGIRALARLAEVSESTVRRYLRGRNIPTAFAERARAVAQGITACTHEQSDVASAPDREH